MNANDSKLAGLNPGQLAGAATSIAGGYGRRFAERGYDWLFETATGQRLLALPPVQRHALELLLYLGKAALERNFNPESPLAKVMKELLSDAGPEIARRLINGYLHHPQPCGALWLQRVLLLPTELRTGLLQWLRQRSRAEQARVTVWLTGLDQPALQAFAALSPDEKGMCVELAAASEPAPTGESDHA